MKLFIVSIFTLLLLSGFVGTILFAFMFYSGSINAVLLLFLIVAFNLLLWLISPRIGDFIYRHFFHMNWMSVEELGERSSLSAAFIKSTCKKYNFPVPKLGIIKDKNPNAFTYGSGRWNSRIIVTEGIFEYLKDENIRAVYAHELGHIKNRDFIIMTLASILIQILYVLYLVCRNSRGSSRKGSGYILAIAVIAYVFYWLAQYVALYLSRVREYYADRFSALETKDPNALAVALVRIAYGILTNPDNVQLVKTTKHIGIMDFKAAESFGLMYHLSQESKDRSLVDKAFLFDIHNPWATVSEIGSTHPLTGKRIRALEAYCTEFRLNPTFDIRNMESRYKVDKGRLFSNFAKDLAALSLPIFALVVFPILYLFGSFAWPVIEFNPFAFLSLWLMLGGISLIIRTVYKYPGGSPQGMRILDLMGDIYASPVRGRRVSLDGRFIGRGVPGLIFSEDFMMQDKTGLIYLNYESWIPLFGNLYFGWSKVKDLVGKQASADGWFLRGMGSRIDLSSMKVGSKSIKSYIRGIGLFWGVLLMAIGWLLMPLGFI